MSKKKNNTNHIDYSSDKQAKIKEILRLLKSITRMQQPSSSTKSFRTADCHHFGSPMHRQAGKQSYAGAV